MPGAGAVHYIKSCRSALHDLGTSTDPEIIVVDLPARFFSQWQIP
jgi:hypothetical protein